MDKKELKGLLKLISDTVNKEVERLKGEQDDAPEYVEFPDDSNTKEYYAGMIEGAIDSFLITRQIFMDLIVKAK